MLRRWIPPLIREYDRKWLFSDLAAGAATWAVLVPLSLSIAAIAGVDPVVGLYGLPLALLAYAIFGGQRVLVMGPDAAVAILSGGAVASIASGNSQILALTIALAIMVGLLCVLFSFLRMGWIADLIPDPVLKGFTEGIIWLTLLKQSVRLLGLQPDEAPSGAVELLSYLGRSLHDVHAAALTLGIVSIAILVFLRLFFPRLPGPLIVLAGSIVISGVLELPRLGVPAIGAVEGGLPALSLPTGLHSGDYSVLLTGALAIVLLGYTKALPALKRAAEYGGDHFDPNKELLALGAANLGAGLGGGHALSASLTATSVNIGAGGKSQLGNLLAGGLCVLTVAFLLPWLYNLPESALAAIIMVALGGVSSPRYFQNLWMISRYEFAIAAAAFIGVLAFGVMPGVIIGVVLAFLKLAYTLHEPLTAIVARTTDGEFHDLDEHPEAQEIPGLLIIHQYGPLVFLNARPLVDGLRKAVQNRRDLKVVVIDATTASGIDSTAADRFISLRNELAVTGIDLWVVNPRRQGWSVVESILKLRQEPVPRIFKSMTEALTEFEKSSTARS